MSFHPYPNEIPFDRDVSTVNLLEYELHSDIHPEQFDNDSLTASSELRDQTVDHGAMSEHIAATTSSLNHCIATLDIDQISASSYLPWHHTVAHGEEAFRGPVVWLGGAVTDAGNEPGDYSVPFSLWGSTDDASNGCRLLPDVNDNKEMEPVMLHGANPNSNATSSGSRNIVAAREKASHTGMRIRMTPTGNASDIPFRVETKRVYICTHTGCNKKYSRMPDLRRHYRGSHLDDRRFQCRALGCERAVRGFPRRDKRDVHEKKMHIDIGDGILL